jgi:hypothetical protein
VDVPAASRIHNRNRQPFIRSKFDTIALNSLIQTFLFVHRSELGQLALLCGIIIGSLARTATYVVGALAGETVTSNFFSLRKKYYLPHFSCIYSIGVRFFIVVVYYGFG